MSPNSMVALSVAGATEPQALVLSKCAIPVPQEGEALIRIQAAAVNRSDVLALRGVLPVIYPRILGRDFGGTVVDGPSNWIGKRVWGTGGGDLGLTSDGSHAEYMSAPVRALVECPSNWSSEQAGSSGLPYLTALKAFEVAGGVDRHDVVLVSGAVGAVGAAAVAAANWKGARTISVVRDDVEREVAIALGHKNVVLSSDPKFVLTVDQLSCGRGVSKAVDTVGGTLTKMVLDTLAMKGSVCILSSPPGAIELNILDFYRRELRMAGLHTGRLSCVEAGETLTALLPGFLSGELPPTRASKAYPLTEAVSAYADVDSGRGRSLLCA